MPNWRKYCKQFFVAALLGAIGIHALDMVSTTWAIHLGAGREANPLLAFNGGVGFYLGRAVYIASVALLLECLIPALFLYGLTRCYVIAALPFLYEIIYLWPVVDHNFSLVFIHLARRIPF